VPGRSLVIAGTATFANGDGLCFLDADDRLEGFRVNRVDDYGRIFPADASVLRRLHKGQKIYRNLDADFERQLSRPTADRRLAVRWEISDVPATGFTLTLATERGAVVEQAFDCPHEVARTPQEANIVRQLLRLGDTPYSADEADITIRFADNWFIPASVLAVWRRELCEKLALAPLPASPVGVSVAEPKELVRGQSSPPRVELERGPLMTCRYCLRYELGLCRKAHDSHAAHLPASAGEPLALRLADGRTFPLRFDCRRCEMQVLRPE
jgi:putative protease